MKHTEGRWIIAGTDGDVLVTLADDHLTCIADLTPIGMDYVGDEAELRANARLIARAPLLAAEHEAVGALLSAWGSGAWDTRMPDAIAALRAAHEAAK